MSLKDKVDLLLDIINNLTPDAVIQNSNAFYDELPVHFYSGLVRIAKDNSLRKKEYQIHTGDIVAGGSSIDDRMLGILKCAAELIERFSLFTFHPKDITFGSSEEMGKKILDPNKINPKVKNSIYGWVKGREINSDEEVSIPAQMVHLNYYNWAKKHHGERKFIQHISNGGCFGFTKESTILRGIYELIERDAILTNYLAHLPLFDVAIDSVKNEDVKKINDTIRQYNFKNILVEATSDLGIPTYFSAAIDESGVVPNVTFGAKSTLHEIDAILGAIEESHMGRTWVRYELMNRDGKIPKINPNTIRTRLERAFYYADKKHSKPLLDSLHKKNFENKSVIDSRYLDSDKKELAYILSILKNKNIRVFAVDIKPAFLNNHPIHVYKIIMPDLQYLYLEERGKNINMKRISSVCHHYGKDVPKKLQTIPHFLL